MKQLRIVWQRLVNDAGSTCPRCGSTEQEIERALVRLKATLEPMGVEPVLETREIDEARFKAQPLESNRVWIDDQALEAWLDGTVGSSACCAACGDSECRTVEVEGTRYEAIPESLLVRAALIAASRLLDPTLDQSRA